MKSNMGYERLSASPLPNSSQSILLVFLKGLESFKKYMGKFVVRKEFQHAAKSCVKRSRLRVCARSVLESLFSVLTATLSFPPVSKLTTILGQ